MFGSYPCHFCFFFAFDDLLRLEIPQRDKEKFVVTRQEKYGTYVHSSRHRRTHAFAGDITGEYVHTTLYNS